MKTATCSQCRNKFEYDPEKLGGHRNDLCLTCRLLQLKVSETEWRSFQRRDLKRYAEIYGQSDYDVELLLRALSQGRCQILTGR